MVVGAGSESFRTLRYLVSRLPVMIAPSWLRTDTQPIGIDATVEFLRRAPEVPESEGREVQIGGPDILSYAEMLDRMAVVMGVRPRRKVPFPLITPWLSALWLGLVTPVDTKVARPLVEGLTTPTVVTDPSGAEPFGIEPEPFDEALRRAYEEESATRLSLTPGAARRRTRARAGPPRPPSSCRASCGTRARRGGSSPPGCRSRGRRAGASRGPARSPPPPGRGRA